MKIYRDEAFYFILFLGHTIVVLASKRKTECKSFFTCIVLPVLISVYFIFILLMIFAEVLIR